MKKILIFIMILMVFWLRADPLATYVAKFDKPLAIKLYLEDLNKSDNKSLIYKDLANLYNETGEIGLAKDCYRHLLDIHDRSEQIYKEYLDFLYVNALYEDVRSIVKNEKLSQSWSQYLLAKSYFQEGEFDSSFLVSDQLPPEIAGELQNLSLEGMNIKYRSPAFGGIMSAIIPGSGKLYAGRILDGIQAFTFVAAPAYNAYYHFSKNGTKSVQGWIWTAIASWYYFSNIYGSVEAVNEYNEDLSFKIIERFEE